MQQWSATAVPSPIQQPALLAPTSTLPGDPFLPLYSCQPSPPWQPPHCTARVFAEPCALAPHGAALGCLGCGQHCRVLRSTSLCFPSARGFLPWPRSGLPPWQTWNTEVYAQKQGAFSPGCLPIVGKTPEANEHAGPMPGDNWVETFCSQVRKILLWECLGEWLTALIDIMVTPPTAPSMLSPVPWVLQAVKPFCSSCLSCRGAAVEAPAVQADPADLIRTQLWRSWGVSLLLLFFMLTTA